MPPNLPHMEVVPFSRFPQPVYASEGYGIFIDHGTHRMQVGSILPYPSNKVLLNVEIMEEMQLPDYDCGAFSEVFDSVETATESARSFLASKRRSP